MHLSFSSYEKHNENVACDDDCFPSCAGIHGEPGIKRSKVSPIKTPGHLHETPSNLVHLFWLVIFINSVNQVVSADEVVKNVIDHMTNADSLSHLPLTSGTLGEYIVLFSLQVYAVVIYWIVCVFLFDSGDALILCVNNLGALSCLEMAVVTRAAIMSLGS